MADSPQRVDFNDWAVVDVFCGAGGLSHGFRRAGFLIAAGIDVDRTCKHAFETNNTACFIGESINAVSGSAVARLYPKGSRRILIGCAPCTPFSSYTPEVKKRRTDKWGLVDVFADRILSVRPEIVSMENVPRLESFDKGRVIQRFIDRLQAEYEISAKVVDCARYGVPQRRARFVLLASRLGRLELEEPSVEEEMAPTVREAIGELPEIGHGEAHPRDRMHAAPRLSQRNLERIRASEPGGSWEDWPEELVAECHKRPTGRWYRNVYGRMEWDAPAHTITTGCFSFGRGRFGHPTQDRAISLREAAMLQTFPQDYEFVAEGDPVRFHILGRQIGNAVPVALAEAIARSIVRHIESHSLTH